MSFLQPAASFLPYVGMLTGAERTRRAAEADSPWRAARAATGMGAAITRAATSGPGLGSAAAGLGGGLGMATGITDSLSVLGHQPSDGVEAAMTGVLGAAGGIAGAARPDTAPWLSAGGLVSSLSGMAARDLEASGHDSLAAGAAILGMGGAGAGMGGAIGEGIAGPAGGLVGAALGGAAGLGAGSVMEIANEDAQDERLLSVNEDHGITGGEAMGVLGLAGTGALIGSVVPAVGTAVGAGVGAAIGGLGALAAAFWD